VFVGDREFAAPEVLRHFIRLLGQFVIMKNSFHLFPNKNFQDQISREWLSC
jgi:hypothetical protein